jgi:hypothetical protein
MHYLPTIFHQTKYKDILWRTLRRFVLQPSFTVFPEWNGSAQFYLTVTGQLMVKVGAQRFFLSGLKVPQALHQYFGMNMDFVAPHYLNHSKYEMFVKDLNQIFFYELPSPDLSTTSCEASALEFGAA